MPIDGSVGHSAHTPLKQELFTTLLRWHTSVTSRVMAKHDWVSPAYVYLDLYAGAGASHGNDFFALPGSPILALRILREQHLPARAVYIESDPETAAILRQRLYAEPGLMPSVMAPDGAVYFEDALSTYQVYGQDHTVAVPALLTRWQEHEDLSSLFGLIYADPNGTPCFDLLRTCATLLPHVDILIHFGATTLKRQRRSPVHPFAQILVDYLKTVPKSYWLVREPMARQQWTFLLGTNWKGLKDWRTQGLCRTDTPMGQRLLNELSYTRKEIEGSHGQGYLFST
jgi:hypothetical protein